MTNIFSRIFGKKKEHEAFKMPDYLLSENNYLPFEGDLNGITPERFKELQKEHFDNWMRKTKEQKSIWLAKHQSYFDSAFKKVLLASVEWRLYEPIWRKGYPRPTKDLYCEAIIFTRFRDELNEKLLPYGLEVHECSDWVGIRKVNSKQQ
jgi:hypothetical protein